MADERAIAVVGSGAAGLGAAFRLQQAGFRVRMFESNGYVGGRMKTIRREGYLIEEGAALFPSTYKNLLGITREAGFGGQVIRSEGIFGFPFDGGIDLIDCDHVITSALRQRALGPIAKAKMLRLIRDCLRYRKGVLTGDLSRLADADVESVADYSDRVLSPEILQYVVGPALRGIAGEEPNRLSVLDLFYTLNLFLGRMRPLVFRDGVSTYAERLTRRWDVELNTRVRTVEEDAAGVSLTIVSPEGTRTDRFAGCILAIPPTAVCETYAALDDERTAFLRQTKSTPSVNINVALRRANPDLRWANLQVPTSVSPDLLAIVQFHRYGPGRAPQGKGQIGVYSAPELSARLMNQPDDVCAQEIMRRVDKVCPGLVDDVEFVHVNRWDPILFVSWPGYYKELRRFQELSAKRDQRIRLAGDYFTVSSMNGATASGETAARALIRHLSHAPTPGSERLPA
jgi:protoporphyrinogen/coproporphyrinogen III oxidase